MNEHVIAASENSPLRQADTAKPDSLALPKALLSILVVIGGYIAVSILLQLLLGGVTVAGYSVAWPVFASLILSAAVILWVKKTRGSISSLGFKRPDSYSRAVLLAVAGTIAVYGLVLIPVSLLRSYGYLPAPEIDASLLITGGSNSVIALLLTLLIMWPNAAFGEELLFRGFLQNNLERALGRENWLTGLISVVVIAFSFGVMHIPAQGIVGLFETGLIGIILGVVFLIGKRSLFTVVLMHGFINSIWFIAMA